MNILVWVITFIIIIAVLVVIWRKTRRRKNHSLLSVRIDSINLNTAKKNAANSFKASRTEAEKAISSSLNQIFTDQSDGVETDNSKELDEISSKLDDLLK